MNNLFYILCSYLAGLTILGSAFLLVALKFFKTTARKSE